MKCVVSSTGESKCYMDICTFSIVTTLDIFQKKPSFFFFFFTVHKPDGLGSCHASYFSHKVNVVIHYFIATSPRGSLSSTWFGFQIYLAKKVDTFFFVWCTEIRSLNYFRAHLIFPCLAENATFVAFLCVLIDHEDNVVKTDFRWFPESFFYCKEFAPC